MRFLPIFLLIISFSTNAQKQIAITIDDLPFVNERSLKQAQESTNTLLSKLKKHKIQSVGFVNEEQLYKNWAEVEERIALLDSWMKNGQELGNHTFSHKSFSELSLEDFKAQTLKGEVVTEKLCKKYGQKERYFRFPFLHTGSDSLKKYGFQQFLQANKYQNAPVTIDADDWYFNKVYVDAQKANNKTLMQDVAQKYLKHTEAYFEYYEKLTQEVLGRPIKHIFLCHVNALNSDYFDELAEVMHKRGYEFITLKDALQDEVYTRPERVITANGFSWLHRWRMTDKKKNILKDPEIPADIQTLYNGK
ncbi:MULTISPECIES: polysaccharide deacetylase family protein [Emticicia]|uniref:polysaccharide deacetylase family protein n=1 Tax=Emticicia TaxID=312278 RepID=UPI0007D8A656|nr:MULTISPECIES: polysaccharide deacetylase family protein [Emticicia]